MGWKQPEERRRSKSRLAPLGSQRGVAVEQRDTPRLCERRLGMGGPETIRSMTYQVEVPDCMKPQV